MTNTNPPQDTPPQDHGPLQTTLRLWIRRAWLPLTFFLLLAGAYWIENSEAGRQLKASLATKVPRGYSTALVDSHGNPSALENFRGQWLVVLFGFVSCPDICPTHLAYLTKELSGSGTNLGVSGRSGESPPVRGIFVSVDPFRDTPPVLESYRKHFDKDRDLITALTGTEEALQEVAQSYGAFFEYQKDRKPTRPEGQYDVAHSTGFYLIDPTGRLVTVVTPPIAPGHLAERLNNARRIF